MFRQIKRCFSKKVDPFAGQYMKKPACNPNRFSDEVAVITGGYQGIGFETALNFIQSGVKGLVVSDITDKGEHVVAELMKHRVREDQKVFFKQTNVLKEEEIKELMDFSYGQFNQLNILVNNAGVMLGEDDLPTNTQLDVYGKTFDVNVLGPYLCIKHSVDYMKKSGKGNIVNVGSLVAFIGSATPQTLYTASKGAVVSMSRELAIVYARENIRINCVNPGPIRTDLMVKFLDTDEKINRRFVHNPLGRLGEAFEIANAISFLASDESSIMTGSNMICDMGITAAYVTPE